MSPADLVRDTLGHIDLGVWRELPPERLASSPELLDGYPPRDASARALKYSRMDGTASYDEIGFRWLAATLVKGHRPLQTFVQARLDAEQQRRRRSGADLEVLLAQTRKLRHRPLEIPDGHVRFTIEENLINISQVPEPGQPDDALVWSFPPGAPPKGLLAMATDGDEPLLVAQHSPANLPLVRWLPLPRLINLGKFARMQDIAAHLESQLFPGNYYGFVSHRWLTPTAPDPDGTQARLLAWQLVAAMCEAVYVAHERGLHTPRKLSPLAPTPIGPYGSDLAEALIVNVLRYALDDADLAAVHAEILPLQKETADSGVPAARSDSGLGRLRELVAGHPLLLSLLDRMHLWYDYSCLPQKPRTPVERQEFRQDLRHVDVYQLLGRTAILLDDADDYLGRAWCMLEALTADVVLHFDVLVGADRSTIEAGRTEHHLLSLLDDRPHVVWRALLDTEVFRTQAPAECLRRLELSATDEADLPAIYAGLCRLGGPVKIHIDGSEVVTGTLPLPVAGRGRALFLPASSATRVDQARMPVGTTSLDWTAAVRLDRERGSVAALRSHVAIAGARRRGCHVVVVGSCEGEAMLAAEWVLAHAADLDRAVGAAVRSLTWLATDVTPVGHFADGVLRTVAVDAPLWVVVAVSTRFTRCATTSSIINTITAAELPYITVALDEHRDNVTRYAPGGWTHPDHARRVDSKRATMAEWPGGLFRDHLFGELVRAVSGGPS